MTRRLQEQDFDALAVALDARSSSAAKIPDELRKLARDPAAFARRVLGVKLTKIQASMLTQLVEHERLALACGQRTGRTMVFAVALVWWCATRPDARAILSTPSHHHMRTTIWRQVAEILRNAKRSLEAECFDLPGRGVQFKNGNEVIGIASDTGERLQGYASPNLLIVVDEAAGYPESLIPSLISNLAGGGRIVIGGNPTNNTSFFARRWKAPGWATMNVSALDVASSADRQPGQADPAWCAHMLEEHGEGSLMYRARVLGEFSEQNANGVFSLGEIEQAQERHQAAGGDAVAERAVFRDAGPLEVGLDVARSGADFSCAVARRGLVALAPVIWRCPDGIQLAEELVKYIDGLRKAGERVTVRVDGVGVGASPLDALRRMPGLRVIDVQAAGSPARDAYTNVRSEAVYVARDWLRAGGCLPRDTKLEEEMRALTYAFDQRNRLKILSKDELRRELGRSTDRFDALALSLYDPPIARMLEPRAIPMGPYAKPTITGRTDLFGRSLEVNA